MTINQKPAAKWHTLGLFVAFLACSGCISEPYPDFVYGRLAASALPRNVGSAFSELSPDATIEAVETSSFKGRVIEYRIHYRKRDGALDQAILDSKGRPVPPPGSFVP